MVIEIVKMNKGTALWERAKEIIPGGSQLLSKRSEMFLPNRWPSYYEKAKGVEIWDLNGNKYIDMSLMGVGTCILGYADSTVNDAVKTAIDKGSMTTLNCHEEIELAELLLELHPSMDMVRFARTGGEAMAVAVRIARSYSDRDKIAFCGYHGWHDWYLSSNLASGDNLDYHLLSELEPKGIPRVLRGTSIPFSYNNIDELKNIIEDNNIGTIVVEPIRYQEPKNDFLTEIRLLADEIDAVLIFDEITSGWRMRLGGIHPLYNVYPDIAVYGKAMGNGFPMAAVIGKRNIMDASQESFISSTFWTERVGPVASLATITKLKDYDVPSHIISIGNQIKAIWEKSAIEHNLKLKTMGIPPLKTFFFDYDKLNPIINTFFTQDMLSHGFLASKSVYVSYSHTEDHIKCYLEAVDDVFKKISKAIETNKTNTLLNGPIAHEGLQHIN